MSRELIRYFRPERGPMKNIPIGVVLMQEDPSDSSRFNLGWALCHPNDFHKNSKRTLKNIARKRVSTPAVWPVSFNDGITFKPVKLNFELIDQKHRQFFKDRVLPQSLRHTFDAMIVDEIDKREYRKQMDIEYP